jgi:hypothetical protein
MISLTCINTSVSSDQLVFVFLALSQGLTSDLGCDMRAELDSTPKTQRYALQVPTVCHWILAVMRHRQLASFIVGVSAIGRPCGSILFQRRNRRYHCGQLGE